MTLNSMKISHKLSLALFVFVFGFLCFGCYSFYTLTQVKINGQMYKEITMASCLQADILPPPVYIIESYLTLFEMRDNMENPQKMTELMDYFTNKLKKEYYERHKFWENDDIFLKHFERIKETILVSSFKPAEEFYRIVEQDYIPALKNKDTAKVNELLGGKLKQLYNEHRKYIDIAVKDVTEQSTTFESHASNIVKSSTFRLILLLVVSMIISIAMFTVIISRILSSLSHTCRIMNTITLKNDLTERISIESTDEIGELSGYFNDFVEKLHGIIRHIADSASTVASSSTELSASSAQIAVNALKLTEQSNVAASAAEQSTVNINSIAKFADDMSHSANAVAAAVEEMSASLKDVAVSSRKEMKIAEEANMHARNSRETMVKLHEAAKSIGNVIGTIKEIADQTNLLALNAKIEAASAGEAGKGFAVVADEVKELARQTAEATIKIEQQVEDIQKNTDSAFKAIEQVSHVMTEVNEISLTNVGAVDEQASTVANIAENISSVSTVSKDVARNVSESAKGLDEVAETIVTVNQSATDISNGINQVRASADDLSKLSEELQNMVKQFKV